jgi:hypothetical protein
MGRKRIVVLESNLDVRRMGMNKGLKAYKLNDSNIVVTKKSLIHNAKDADFTEVRLIASLEEIKEWVEEIELLELDDEEYF